MLGAEAELRKASAADDDLEAYVAMWSASWDPCPEDWVSVTSLVYLVLEVCVTSVVNFDSVSTSSDAATEIE